MNVNILICLQYLVVVLLALLLHRTSIVSIDAFKGPGKDKCPKKLGPKRVVLSYYIILHR